MKKWHETLCATILLLGLLYIIGTGGGLDQNTLTIGQALIHAIIGIVVAIGAARIGGFWQ